MAEVVVRGAHLPLRTQIAAELTRRIAERTGDVEDGILLSRPAVQMSMSFDEMQPAQALRIARALVVVAEELRRPFSVPGAPAADVEIAAQLAAIGMIVARAFGLS